ncbi:MAG: NUDIX domain-containing protein [Bacteroidetes bacterium]|nr:NUDIX domain-containing protein [Bacteroidota bacterium]
MLPERFLYVDKNNKVLSDDESYGCNPSLLWKRASGGFVFDPISLKLLCHKGTILKEKRPGKWVCTFGGKANQSESPDETAIRELYEEYELKVDKRNIFYLGLFRSDIRSQFESIYLYCLPNPKLIL